MSNTLAIVFLFLLFILLGYVAWWSWRQVRHNRSMSDLAANQMGSSEIEREMEGAGASSADRGAHPPISPSTFGAPIAAGMAAGTAEAASHRGGTSSAEAEAGHIGQPANSRSTPQGGLDPERVEPTLKPQKPASNVASTSKDSPETDAASPVMQSDVTGSPASGTLPRDAKLHPSRTYTEGADKPQFTEGLASHKGGLSSEELARDAENQTRSYKGRKPRTMDGPGFDTADNLQAIVGIEHNVERKLNQLGIWHFSQIIEWDEDEIDWVQDFLGSSAHVRRDDWQGQAERLEAMNAPKT